MNSFTLQSPIEDKKNLTALLDQITDAVKKHDGEFFELTVTDSDGKEIDNYFELALNHRSTEKKAVELVKETIKFRGEEWEDDETPMGLWWAVKLAHHSEKHIPLFTDYIRSTDLDHQVYQGEEILKVIEKYGWNKHTYKLFAECVYECYYLQEGMFDTHGLLEKLAGSKKEEKLFFKLLAQAEDADPVYIEEWREKYENEVRFKIKGEVDFDELFHPVICDNDFDKAIELMNQYPDHVREMDLIRVFNFGSYKRLDFIKELVRIHGKEQFLAHTQESYFILNSLYEKYRINKECIDYLWEEGCLAYVRKDPLEPMRSSHRDMQPIAYFISDEKYWEDEFTLNKTKEMFNELIDRGCDVNEAFDARGYGYEFVLQYALKPKSPCWELIDLLIERGADMNFHIDSLTDNGELKSRKSVLTEALRRAEIDCDDMDPNVELQRKRSAEMFTFIKKIIALGAEYEPIEPGFDLSYDIMKTKNIDIIEYFYDLGCLNIHGRSWNGIPALFAASDDPEIVKWALAQGADISSTNFRGQTLLFSAVRTANLPEIQFLIELGIDQSIVDNKGQTARDEAFNKLDELKGQVKNADKMFRDYYQEKYDELASILQQLGWEK